MTPNLQETAKNYHFGSIKIHEYYVSGAKYSKSKCQIKKYFRNNLLQKSSLEPLML